MIVTLAAAGGAALGFMGGSRLEQTWLDHRIAQVSQAVLAQTEDIFNEAAGALDTVNRSKEVFCSSEELTLLRSVFLKSKYIKDIGRLQDKQLVCTSNLGILPNPHPTKKVPVIMPGGLRLFHAETLLLAGQLPGVVIEKGNANAVLDLSSLSTEPPEGMSYILSLTDKVHRRLYPLATAGMTNTSGTEAPSQDEKETCSHQFPICITVTVLSGQSTAHAIPLISMAFGALASAIIGFLALRIHRNRNALPIRFRRAIAAGELNIVYQPIVSLPERRIVAAEALMRWPDGKTPPDLLAEIAEAGGFSNEITAFVMETVLVDMAEPFAAGTDFRVTVNVSPGELLDGSLLATLKHQWPARLPQKHVGFELTERSTASLSDLKEMIAFLRAAGHPVYIDDFGTGYSSLAQVHDLSVDFIKIDRSFLHKLNHSASILPEILAIARRLDVGLVIEGIENEEQAHYFESIDASRILAQGWLFGRPMSAKDLLAAAKQVAVSVP